MIPHGLGRLVLGRRQFWTWVAVIFALKIGVVVLLATVPQSFSLLGHFDSWLMLGLAFVVGARFADVRWPRWLGITLVIVITFAAPVALALLQPSKSTPHSDNPLDNLPDLAWIFTLAMLVLLLVVGLKRSPAEPSGGVPGTGTPTPGT